MLWNSDFSSFPIVCCPSLICYPASTFHFHQFLLQFYPYFYSQSKNIWMTTEGAPVLQERKKSGQSSLLCQIHWRRVILDEAHNIKNHSCATSISTCFIEAGNSIFGNSQFLSWLIFTIFYASLHLHSTEIYLL